MADLEMHGFDELNNVFNRIGDIPFDVTAEALNAMADVAIEQVRQSGEAMGVRDEESNVHILDKLVKKTPVQEASGGHLTISYDGTRHRGNTDTRNAEIAFVTEYGKRGQPARPFMRRALEHDEEISEPGERIIGDWIENEYEKG